MDLETNAERCQPHVDCLQDARRRLNAFKFQVLETVAADPQLHGAQCLPVMLVHCSFMTVDERTLKATPVYASNTTLLVRAGGGLKSMTSARKARRRLVEKRYLVRAGQNSRDGSELFFVQNPHSERVADHIKAAAEFHREVAAERKKEERRKGVLVRRGSRTAAPEVEWPVSPWYDAGPTSDPNYLRDHLGVFSSEEKSVLPSNLKLVLPTTSDCEADAVIAAILPNQCIPEGVRAYWRRCLALGTLSLGMIEEYVATAPGIPEECEDPMDAIVSAVAGCEVA